MSIRNSFSQLFLFLGLSASALLHAQMTPCSQIGVNCTPYPCSVICNPEVCHVNGTGGELSVVQVAGWGRTSQSPDCYPFQSPLFPFPVGARDVSGWSHGLSPGPNGEAFAADAAVVAGEEYLFAFWYRALPKITANQAPYVGAMFARLVDFSQASYPTNIPQGSQIVFSDSMMPFHADTFWQAVSCFRASQSYNAVWFYPLQESGLEQVSIGVTQAEMIPLAFSAGPDVNSSAGASVIVGDTALCSVYGAVWEWRELGQNTVLGNGTTLTVSPSVTTSYVLTRAFPQAIWQRDYIAGASSCATADTVTVIIEGLGLQAGNGANSWSLPMAFSPNGDGMMDEFRISGNTSSLVVGNFDVEIFDLRGQSVFSSKSYNFSWNGAGASDGIYFYRIQSRLHTGSPALRPGRVLLMR